MDKTTNIYQKIAILQERITVEKSSTNTFANFKYRTIQDILRELKPLLKELEMIVTFSSGTLDGDKYSLGMLIIDIKDPNMKLSEYGEIYIDRDKSKMDLSQKVLSAKTFLKKSLLEDLLLINEDEDPDSHNNTPPKAKAKAKTNKTTSKPASKPASKPTTSKPTSDTTSNTTSEKEIRQKLKKIIYLASDKSVEKSIEMLEELSSFIGKDNNKVEGIKDFELLKGKRLTTTYSIAKKKYEDIVKKIEESQKKS